MSLKPALSTYQNWILLALFGVLAGAAVGLGVASQIPAGYAGRATVLATPPMTGSEIGIGDHEVTRALMPTLADLATTGPLLGRVVAATDVDIDAGSLARTTSVRVPVNTTLLEITVLADGAQDAAVLANAVASELVDSVAQGALGEAVQLGAMLSVIDPAEPPTTREGIGPLTSAVLGAAVGLIVVISLAFLVESFRQETLEG